MFGLVSLQQAAHPHTTLEKMIFIVENVWRAHKATTIISFSALAALVVLRTAKRSFRGTWWIYRLPEVLVVVITATGQSSTRRADKDEALIPKSFSLVKQVPLGRGWN
jgi:MFS superfamily sulfate permease-like transporter